MNLDRIPVLSSPNRTVVTGPHRVIDLVVIHDMEWSETDKTAELCAGYFAKPTTKASAHYCADSNSIVQCVPLADVAWAAPGANHNGIQIELAGYAAQTKNQWSDEYSTQMLKLAAELTAALCKKHNLPVRFVDAAGIRAGKKGITTHAEVTKAFPERGSHTDPGPNFPMSTFISRVLVATQAQNPPPPKVITYQLLFGLKVVAESAPVEGKGAAAERVRVDAFLHNQLRRIHAQLSVPGGLPVSIKRKVA